MAGQNMLASIVHTFEAHEVNGPDCHADNSRGQVAGPMETGE
jgi:hypothetical protein